MSQRDSYGRVGVDEFLFQGIAWYRSHLELIWPFVVAGIFALLFELRIETLELLYFDDDLSAILSERLAEQLDAMTNEILWLLILGTALLALITLLLVVIAVGFAFLTAADEHRQRQRLGTTRFRVAVARAPALFVATVVAGLLVGFGLLLLVIPGIYLAVKFVLAGPAIVADEQGPFEGLRTSWRQTDGQFSTVLLLLVLSGISFILVALLPLVGELLAVAGVLPVVSLALAALYFDTLETAT